VSAYTVYEVVREVRHHRWIHHIDAANSDEALAKAKAENDRACYHGELGEPKDVDSGWALRPKAPDQCDEDAWDEAFNKLSELGSRQPESLNASE
jgi:hypothetical protein